MQLRAADGGLRIEGLQVVAEMAVDVFVIVALGQVAEFPAETFAAGIVVSAGAPAVTAPIAEAFHERLERHVAHDIDRAPLAHREVMRRIKGLRGEVAEGAGKLTVIARTERVAVVLDEPEVVAAAELGDGREIEGVAQGVGHEDGFGFARNEGLFELIDAHVERDGIDIEKDGDAAVLNDGRNGRGKARRRGDDLIAGTDTARTELGAGQRGEGEQVGRRARVDEERFFDAEERRQLFFESLALGAEGEPEVERGRDSCFNLVLVKDATRVRDRVLAAVKW